MEKELSLQQLVLQQLEFHVQKNEVRSQPHTTDKVQLKKDQRPKYKSSKQKNLLEENREKKPHDTVFGNDFLAMIPKTQATTTKN